MAGAVVAVEFVILAEPLEHRLGAVDLIGGRILVVVAENAEQRTGHFLGEIDRRDRALAVEILRIVDDDVAAPAIDGGIDARQRAGGEIGVAAAGAESDDADFAVGVRLRAQIGHGAGNIAHDLGVGDAARGAHARADIVGAAGAFAEIKMRRDRRIAVMRELAHHFHDPFVPARQVMDHDNAGKFSRRAAGARNRPRPGRHCGRETSPTPPAVLDNNS